MNGNDSDFDDEIDESHLLDPLRNEDNPQSVMHAGKVYLLLQILAHSRSINEKVVVFSQCLRTLDFLEQVLGWDDWGEHVHNKGNLKCRGSLGRWKRNVDYLRIDGAVNAADRGDLIELFERPQTSLFLISIQAGGIG